MSSKEGGGEIESGRIVRRAALDIGSGSTKYCVADVDLLLNSVLKIVLRNQFEVFLIYFFTLRRRERKRGRKERKRRKRRRRIELFRMLVFS